MPPPAPAYVRHHEYLWCFLERKTFSAVIVLPYSHIWGFPGGSEGKASACNAGDCSSIPGSGRSPGQGNGNPLRYSCLENPTDRGAWWATVHGVTKSQTRLSDFTSQPYLGSAINGLKFWIKVYKEKFLLKKKYFKYYPNIWKVKAILAGIT